jgi:hypothetical protein
MISTEKITSMSPRYSIPATPVPQDPVQNGKQTGADIVHEVEASAKSYGTGSYGTGPQLGVLVSIWMGHSPSEALAYSL